MSLQPPKQKAGAPEPLVQGVLDFAPSSPSAAWWLDRGLAEGLYALVEQHDLSSPVAEEVLARLVGDHGNLVYAELIFLLTRLRLDPAEARRHWPGVLARRAEIGSRVGPGRDVERSLRHNTPLSRLVLDLDDFRRVNDLLGHDAVTGTLRDLAKILRTRARASDLVVRCGGGEFVVVLPAIPKSGAARVAETLRAVVKSFRMQPDDGLPPMSLTFSTVSRPAPPTRARGRCCSSPPIGPSTTRSGPARTARARGESAFGHTPGARPSGRPGWIRPAPLATPSRRSRSATVDSRSGRSATSRSASCSKPGWRDRTGGP